VILVGGIDLSVGWLIALTTVTGSLAFQHIGGGFVTLVAMLLTGLLVGLINAVLYVKGRMPHSFIPTLAMLNAATAPWARWRTSSGRTRRSARSSARTTRWPRARCRRWPRGT
jgi:ribose/xylose/arabinose/galactoside ABC-type transport system permease subunit